MEEVHTTMRGRARRPLAALAVAACAALALCATTLAYFTDSETAHNVVTSGGVDVELVEKTKVGDALVDFPEEGILGVMPGDSVSKIVTVENAGAAPAWVRVKVEESVRLADGAPAASDAVESYLEMDFDLDSWTPGADGWWYWTGGGASGALAPGASTDALFTGVSFSKLMPNELQGCRAYVDVAVQAVQTANNGSTVWEAQGWPADGAAADAPTIRREVGHDGEDSR